MRAWRVDRPGEPSEVLRLTDVPVPEPCAGQIRVRVTAAGIGLPDVFMCRHTYPLTPLGDFTPGQEGTGVVSAVGPDVDMDLGTRVMSPTSFMEGSGSFAVGIPRSCTIILHGSIGPGRRRRGWLLDTPPHGVDRSGRPRSPRTEPVAGRAWSGGWQRDRCRAARSGPRSPGDRGCQRRRPG